jgi:hypothetical protein
MLLAAPLAATGLPIARPVIEAMVVAVVVVVVLSQRRGPIGLLVLGLAATLVSLAPRSEWPRVSVSAPARSRQASQSD